MSMMTMTSMVRLVMFDNNQHIASTQCVGLVLGLLGEYKTEHIAKTKHIASERGESDSRRGERASLTRPKALPVGEAGVQDVCSIYVGACAAHVLVRC